MFQFDQFDHSKHKRPLCLACEEMLTDAVDQTLSPADQAWFEQHLAACIDCSRMVADAQRGAAWLQLLRTPRPEPSAALLERILAQTSDQASDQIIAQAIAQPLPLQPIRAPFLAASAMSGSSPANLLAFRPRAAGFGKWFGPRAGGGFEPRLAMTAAMAFFSIALTLNLAGVRLDQLKAGSLKPSSVKRSYYEASAEAVRYYDNLRVVHVVESRVDDLREASAAGSPADDRPASTSAEPKQNPPTGPRQTAPNPNPQLTQPGTQPGSQPDTKPETKPDPGVSTLQTPDLRPDSNSITPAGDKTGDASTRTSISQESGQS